MTHKPELHYSELRDELDRRDETINSYKKLLADERAEVERLKQQLATARKDAMEEAGKQCDESEAEAQRLKDISPDRDHALSRTSWVNTSRMLGQQIRALKTKE
jgi:predicted RNase H-like nuclease (RuvC/YqgF family)